MNLKLSQFVLVAILSTVIGANSAEAQLGRYQKKIAGGAIAGGKAGYDATGHWGGAIVGGAAGAGYADYQHNSNKTYNYRTSHVNWSSFEYGNGRFVRQGQVWIEFQNGHPAFQFLEVNRTPHFIDLFDQSRHITVRIENGRTLILLPGRNWQPLYLGRNH